MKKNIFFVTLFAIYYLIFAIVIPNPATPSASDSEIRDQLIENIASRVAELKLVEKRGIVGVVTDVSNTQITISDAKTKQDL